MAVAILLDMFAWVKQRKYGCKVFNGNGKQEMWQQIFWNDLTTDMEVSNREAEGYSFLLPGYWNISNIYKWG